jgi:putative oxidoreductase
MRSRRATARRSDKMMIGHGVLAARLCLAIVFLYSGVEKLWYWRASLKEVQDYGLPWPGLCAVLTIVAQLWGGILLVSGYAVWLGALLLGGFTIMATLLGHRFWLYRGERFRHELTTTLEHLAIVGGFLLLVIFEAPAIFQ